MIGWCVEWLLRRDLFQNATSSFLHFSFFLGVYTTTIQYFSVFLQKTIKILNHATVFH